MNLVDAALRRIAADLERLRCRWALVGGFAVSARVEPRFTRDVDIALAVPDDDTAERVVRTLLSEGYRFVASVEHDEAGRLATIRLATDQGADQDVIVDLLFASSGVEAEIVAAAEPLELLPGLTVPVATAGHLIAVKVLARDDDRRPQDLADLRALVTAASADDVELARTTVRLITERGFNRGRDLDVALAVLLGTEPPA
ncbi:MAG: hypothetical protein GEV12_22900 [Micromonosporaceae bacterium]|nr:hypothetical protein [Micromonosporaceae bacterium]